MPTTIRLLALPALALAGLMAAAPAAQAATSRVVTVQSVCQLEYSGATGAVYSPGSTPAAYGWSCTSGNTVLGPADLNYGCQYYYPGTQAVARNPGASQNNPTWTCTS